jgi:hypothetical protein
MQKTRFPLGQYPRTDASPLILIPEDEQQSWMCRTRPLQHRLQPPPYLGLLTNGYRFGTTV